MLEHERIHSEEKPHSCSQCDGNFELKEDLLEHERIHIKEKPFSCLQCDKRFKEKSDLLVHELTHKCEQCGSILKEKERLIENEEEVAKTFNKFFPEKVTKIESKIPVYNIDPITKLREKLKGQSLHFSLTPVTEHQVEKTIKSIKSKSSSGVDFISTKVLKSVDDIIADPLCFIINNSIKEGIFPKSWKIAKCIPIYKKKGNKHEKEFYRPVSLLKAVSKIPEKIANQQLMNHFESNNLLPESQHGFRKHRSTFTAVSQMHELWIKNKENKLQQAVSFLDLSAAFDTISKDIICQKLKAYGANKSSVNWFNSYLSERSQRVMIGSTMSEPVELLLGSPQGSILSPSLFLVLISDIELYCPNAVLSGYADDTSCTIAVKNSEDLKEECEENVNSLLKYMAINKLACNDDKTHIIVIRHGQGNEEKFSFKVGEAEIKESISEKLLGAWINNDLSWTKHLKKLEDELNYRLYKLRRIEQVLPRSLLKKVADAIFCSVLRYELAIFCPIQILQTDPKPSCIQGIRVAYHNLLRLLCYTKRESHTSIESMLEKLDWLSVNQLSCEIRLIEVWKAINYENHCHNGLFEIAHTNQGNTRSAGLNKLKSCFKTKIRENSYSYPSIQIWNSAPSDVTTAATETKARKAIRSYVKTLPV